MAGKQTKKSKIKAMVKKRTLNPPDGNQPVTEGAPFNNQDTKRRLGNFATAGEHPRVGGRTTGIVGQKKQKLRGDRKG